MALDQTLPITAAAPASGDNPPAGTVPPNGPAGAPPPDRAPRRWRRWLLRAAVVSVALLLAISVALFTAVHTERGTRWAWQAALAVMGGKLSGQWRGGTLASGIHVSQLAYRDGATRITIDRLDGRWALSAKPWRFTLDTLRVGTVDAQFSASAPSTGPVRLPERLTLPLSIVIKEISVHKLTLRTPDLEISDLLLRGRSDGRHHTLTLEHVTTPYGQATAALQLDGVRPFALGGDATLATEYQKAPYQLAVRLGGSLGALTADLTASGGKLNGQAHVEAAPFGAVPLTRVQVMVDHLNPRIFSAGAPRADLSLHADLAPLPGAKVLSVAGPVIIENVEPGPLDRERLPVVGISAQVVLDEHQQSLPALEIRLAGGAALKGGGGLKIGAGGGLPQGKFALQAMNLDLRALYGKLPASRLNGPLTAVLDNDGQQITVDWRDAARRIRLDTVLSAKAIELRSAELTAGPGKLTLTGTLAHDESSRYQAKAVLTDFNPSAWFGTGTVPANAGSHGKGVGKALAARINGQLDASGALVPALATSLKFVLHDSVYAGLPMTGGGTVSVAGERVLPSDAQLVVAGNRVALKGSFGAPGDRLAVNVNAPQLDKLGFGLSGVLQLDGQLDGTLARPNVRASFHAQNLVFGAQKLAALNGKTDIEGGLHAGPSGKLGLTIDAQGYRSNNITLKQASVNLAGTRGRHDLRASAAGQLRGQPLALSLAANGVLTDGDRGFGWDGTIRTLENHGSPRFSLNQPWRVTASADRVILGGTRMTLADAVIELTRFNYDRGQIHSEGSINALDIGKVLTLVTEFAGRTPPLASDLVLDGRWNIALAQRADGFLQIDRKRGDIALDMGHGMSALGLGDLHLRADLQANRATVDARMSASRVGKLTAQLQTALTAQNGAMTVADDAPLAGRAVLDVPDLNTVGGLLGPKILLKGRASAQLALSGVAGKPKLSGRISGDNLALTLFDLGIQLHDGTVRIAMDNNIIDLKQVEFHGGDGTLRAGGRIQLGEADPALAATISADKLQLFAAPDRTLILSGQAKITNPDHQLGIDGKFTVDRALFDLPPASAPALGDDVVIVRHGGKTQTVARNGAEAAARAAQKPANRFSPRIDLDIDLGRDFRFKGASADLQLRGAMHIHSAPLQAMRATGTIHVAQGTYEAFDRKLAIEQGTINFDGPIDNPNIYIRAMRRNQDVEAGVQVTGTVRQPRVELVSEPNVAQEEKLSWLMFGHGSDSGGLGQQRAAGAALAMLGNAGGKRIAKNFGIDEFSIGPSESGLPDQQVVNLGKAITEKLSIGYEQSLTSAASIAKLTWQLSRRWQLVAGGGAINSLDVFFSRRFD